MQDFGEVEESAEFQSALLVNFADFAKVFDSVLRTTLWDILREYGIPKKIVTMIRILYNGFMCAVLHEGKLSPCFAVETGVKQGCLLSGLLVVN